MSTQTTPLKTEKILASFNKASQTIAPTWPLDQMIAVNPFWELRSQPFETVAAQLAARGNIHCLMPKAYYSDLNKQGEICASALHQAAQHHQLKLSQAELEAFLEQDETLPHWQNISKVLDRQRTQQKHPGQTPAWQDEIVSQISQFCAAHYQTINPLLGRGIAQENSDLYTHWLDVARHDYSVQISMKTPKLRVFFQQLPERHEDLLLLACTTLQLQEDQIEAYAHSLLLDINGWASWVAYLRWQGNLYAEPQDETLQLLAIRLAWDLVIWNYTQANKPEAFATLSRDWQQQTAQIASLTADHASQQKPLWVWAQAAELTYQSNLNKALKNNADRLVSTPELQAVFCIDVRSEVIRRALETQNENIQTLGFTGFFGLPLEFQPTAGDFKRPQLPGLLKPVIHVSTPIQASDIATLAQTAQLQAWAKEAPSAFSMVESIGLMNAFKSLKKSFFPDTIENPVNHFSHKNRWVLKQNDIELTAAEKAQSAKEILTAMNLTSVFAPVVLLVGHGSHTTNNLQAAGLDCGACGGQTGEVNVRILAEILNNPEVREHLLHLGLKIPKTTEFIAALHNTTTDHINTFNTRLAKPVQQWLLAATAQAQQERKGQFNLALDSAADAHTCDHAFIARSQDWSQVRPEWGLANNAAFIIAPRAWTRGINLQGRSFLHDYTWQADPDATVLELILTAPMIVTNWINMQYNASATDNLKYGSGSKVFHNAVGGHIGIFEGNGGDLRIGLAMQSLHNGQKWMHSPQRLAVYVAAPRERIETITYNHENVAQLINNDWLYLLRMSDDKTIERFYQGQWQEQQD